MLINRLERGKTKTEMFKNFKKIKKVTNKNKNHFLKKKIKVLKIYIFFFERNMLKHTLNTSYFYTQWHSHGASKGALELS